MIWLLKDQIYNVFGVKMALIYALGTILMAIYLSLILIANLLYAIEDIKQYLKKKQWIE